MKLKSHGVPVPFPAWRIGPSLAGLSCDKAKYPSSKLQHSLDFWYIVGVAEASVIGGERLALLGTKHGRPA